MRPYYYAIDGVRFLSALFVCLFHLGFYAWASTTSSMSRVLDHVASFEPLTPFTWFGWVGVQIFFVISGFVIANSANGATPWAFVRSRLLRLMPAAWVCASVTLGALLASGAGLDGGMMLRYARSMTLWLTGDWIDGVYWTLAIEIVFYAMVFGLLVAKRFALVSWLAWAMAGVSAVYLSLAFLHDHHLGARGTWFDMLAGVSELLPLKHGVFFALGIWIWMTANGRGSRTVWTGIALAVGLGVFQIACKGLEVQAVEAAAAQGQSVVVPVLLWLAALAVIMSDAWMPGRLAPKSKGARSFLMLAGKTTYPLYLVHGVAGTELLRALVMAGVPAYLALVIAIAAAVGAAVTVARVGEPFLRDLLKSVLDGAARIVGVRGARVSTPVALSRVGEAAMGESEMLQAQATQADDIRRA